MKLAEIKETLKTQPFAPFTIYLADGRNFHVPHREFIAHSPVTETRTVIVFNADGSFDLIDIQLITSIQVHAPNSAAPPDPGSNGG